MIKEIPNGLVKIDNCDFQSATLSDLPTMSGSIRGRKL